MDSKSVKIKSAKANAILDSQGKLTVEAELGTNFGKFKASIPSGVSTGKYEAVELRDSDGRGVSKAIENIEKIISPALKDKEFQSQREFDEALNNLDGTKNKSRLGANAILPLSISFLRATANAKKKPLYKYISEISGVDLLIMPKPSFNMIEGGKHSDSGLAFQEFMIVPQKEKFKENFEIGIKIYKKLKDVLKDKFKGKDIRLSKEGAYSVPIKEISAAFDLILEAARKISQENNIKFAVDAAASSFFSKEGYKVDGKTISKETLIDFYGKIIENYPVISYEDPFEEEDFLGFPEVIEKMGEKMIFFGDDLLASNAKRIMMAEAKGTYNGLILKPNQIGTVTETVEAARLAKNFGWKIMVANRAGETKDDFIADLAVGVGAEFIKSGAPYPKERMAKYNRLLKIEKELY